MNYISSDGWHYNEIFVCALDQSDRVHSFEKFHPSRYQARQLLDGARQEGQPCLYHRFWVGKEIQRRSHTPAHPLPRK